MPDLQPLVSLFVGDPILGYSLLAALFLALVSVTAGLARLDLAALGNPRPALVCALCVAASVLLRLLIYGDLQEAPAGETPLMAGLEHFPLVLAALAYGPTPGLVVAALYANFGAQGELPLARQGVLALELALVGWLAIYPSPREHRWAGPVDAILGYTLAWATAGLALAQWQYGGLGIEALLAQHTGTWPGVLASAFLLLLIRPGVYRWLFPQSRIYETAEEAPVVIEPISDDRGERSRTDLTQFDLPPADRGRRRRRRSRT
ncbi:MAG TPA: hypothetical protein VF168_11385 [Trueperaceae bacterium]